jgi:SnoaL-like domain
MLRKGAVMSDASDQIRNLMFAYAEAVDRGNFDRLSELFAHGTLRLGGGPGVSGTDAGAFIRDAVIVYDDGTPRTKHVTTNIAIEVDDANGRATAHSYVMALQHIPGRGIEVILSSRYEDTFERVGGVWRFADRVSHRDLTGDVTHHLRRAAGHNRQAER